ncbi:MAG: PH domain-containing protein [Spirochaetales bacterium]|nr:PH domain-containing protein [Spirochaetales bacterium]
MKKIFEAYHRLRFKLLPQAFHLDNATEVMIPVSWVYSGLLALLIIPVFPILSYIKDNFVLFVLQWLDIFKLEEIFTFTLPSQRVIENLYDILALVFSVWMVLLIMNMLLKHILAVIIIYPEKLLVHTSNFIKKTSQQIQREGISVTEYKQNILQRLLFVGDLKIFTRDKEVLIPAIPVKEAARLSRELGL